MNPTYSVSYYVNGELTFTTKNLPANEAYTRAIPPEALANDPKSRWHVMLRYAAIERLQGLLAGETLRVCWQEPSIYNWPDTEHILIAKEPYDKSKIYNMIRNINQ